MQINGTQEDFNLIVGSAVRYALGRKTYIVSTTCDYVKKNIEFLSDNTLNVIARDITMCEDKGDICDEVEWNILLDTITNQLESRKTIQKK